MSKHRLGELLTVEVQTATHERKMRRYGRRPEQVVLKAEHRVVVRRKEGAIAQAKREMGWQVYAANQPGLGLGAVVRGYRGQYRLEKGWSRLKGRPLSVTPMYLQSEKRMEGLVLLLSLALRLLTLLEGVVRRQLQQSGEKLRGLYPGQPGRQTQSPSAELLLHAFTGVSLSVVEVDGQRHALLTPLSPLQQRLLQLWDLPPDLYHRLTLHCSKPPPVFGER